MILSALDDISACASVFATMNSTPRRPETIILLTALPPAPPMPATIIWGLSSRSSGALRLIVIVWPLDVGAPFKDAQVFVDVVRGSTTLLAAFTCRTHALKTAFEPPPYPPNVSLRLRVRRSRVPRRAEMLDTTHLRIDQKSDCRRKSWTFRGLGQSLDTKGPPDPDLSADNAFHRCLHAGQLAGSAGENNPSPSMSRKARLLEPVAHEFEDFLDARLDDRNELRLWQMRGVLAIFSCPDHRDRLAFVSERCQACAIQRLQTFGVCERHAKAACNIHCDMIAANGKTIDMNEMAAGKYADCRRSRAHVDQSGTKLGLVIGQGCKAGRVGRRNHRIDRQMAAFNREDQIACRRGVAAQYMHFGAKFLANHAPRIADMAGFSLGKADRQRMQNRPALLLAAHRASLTHAVHVGLPAGPASARDLGIIEPRGQAAACRVDDHAFDLHAGHPFGCIDGKPDRGFRRLHVDNGAALDAARALMSDAENAAAMGAPAQRLGGIARIEARNETDDF